MPNLEQFAKILLVRAMKDGLVACSSLWEDPDPHQRTVEELSGMVSLLKQFAREIRESE